MIVRYWQPFQDMNSVKKQLDQLLDDFAGIESTPTAWTPAVALVESEDALTLQVQLPGISAEQIDIQASREVVSISGDRTSPEPTEGEKVRRNEFRFGPFRRVVSLPVAIDPQGVSADYQAGILVLTLPKAEDERNKVVKVTISSDQPALNDRAPADAGNANEQ
ncbi:MAG: Hsp20/alpha crystallin family protein [Phormidesmis sp. RL_2_1]|nr:Hsp20/alpha crystallin family protein [Phormidesmis sp. RL_2_1]